MGSSRRGVHKIDSYEQVAAVKAPAQDAEEAAEITRMEMKAAGSEREWKRTLEKYKSREFEALIGQLVQNQRSNIQASKQRMMSQKQLRQLEIERNQLSAKLREMQDKAREEEQRKRDKDSSRDKDREHDKDREKDHHKESNPGNPGKVLVE